MSLPLFAIPKDRLSETCLCRAYRCGHAKQRCVHKHAYIREMHTSTNTCIQVIQAELLTNTCAQLRIYKCKQMQAHASTCKTMQTHANTGKHMHAYACEYKHANMHTQANAGELTRTHTHTHTHTHAHTHTDMHTRTRGHMHAIRPARLSARPPALQARTNATITGTRGRKKAYILGFAVAVSTSLQHHCENQGDGLSEPFQMTSGMAGPFNDRLLTGICLQNCFQLAFCTIRSWSSASTRARPQAAAREQNVRLHTLTRAHPCNIGVHAKRYSSITHCVYIYIYIYVCVCIYIYICYI